MKRRRWFGSGTHARGRGGAAERVAEQWLRRCGFEIVRRNATVAGAEIDLIAREGDTLCFVEVKARSSADARWALSAVGPEKQRRIARAAGGWLARHPHDGPCRFDVLILHPETERRWRVRLLRDAFQAPEGW